MNISIIPNQTTYPIIKCSQNDTSLRTWTFNLINGNEIVTPEGDASLVCSNGVEIPLTKDGDDLYCDCTAELSANSGKFDCKIKLNNDGEVIYSALFILKVEVKP